MDDLQRLSIIEDIRNLKARYARFADLKQWSDLASVFTPDGIMSFYDVDGSLLGKRTGRQEIQDAIAASVGEAQPIHHLFSHEIEVTSSTTANGLWAMEDLITFPKGVKARFKVMHGYGHYHETYEKIDGKWLIKTLQITRVKLDYEY